MNTRQKKSKKIMAWLMALILVTGMMIMPHSVAKAASEDVIILTPDDSRDEEAGEQIQEAEEETEQPVDEPGEDPEEPVEQQKSLELTHPASFQAVAVKNGIKISWKTCENAQKYEVFRKKLDEDAYTLIRTTKNCTYTDKTAVYGETYIYKARAIAVSEGITYKSACSVKKSCCTYHVDPSKPMVALTFDDGPSQYTEGILDALEKNNARATFFELGNRVKQYPDVVLRIDKIGCEIGNHSYDHAILGNASAAKIAQEIKKTDTSIQKITGKMPVLLRPPYGSIGSNLRKNAGKPMIMWSIDTLDWKTKNVDKVYQCVMSRVKDGDIILMHDLYQSSREAAKRLIPALKKRGYQLVTVSELAEYKQVHLKAGERYSQMR